MPDGGMTITKARSAFFPAAAAGNGGCVAGLAGDAEDRLRWRAGFGVIAYGGYGLSLGTWQGPCGRSRKGSGPRLSPITERQ